MDKQKHLQAIIEPAVTALGFELLGCLFIRQGFHSVLRIYIDSASGITLDDCALVSHQVSAILDVEDPLPGAYTLEVSSPGLDRPLFSLAQFMRYIGESVKLRLHPGLPRRNYQGQLLQVTDHSILLQVDNTTHEVAFADIERANLVPKL